MSSSGAKAAQSKTMTKAEVIAYLGKSKRSVETYISSGRLPAKYFNGPNGKTAIFERVDVEAFKRGTEELWHPAPKANGTALAIRPAAAVAERAAALPAADLAFIFERAREYAHLAPKPWLDVKAAVDYSGLPASFLVQAAREGKIRAVNVGQGKREFWRFNREALAK